MHEYNSSLQDVEDTLRLICQAMGYEQVGPSYSNEFKKNDGVTSKVLIYERGGHQIVCHHTTRLLLTGSRKIQVQHVSKAHEVTPLLKNLDNTILKY